MQKKKQGLNVNEARKSGGLAMSFLGCYLIINLEQGCQHRYLPLPPSSSAPKGHQGR